jgi:hypothetical protein
MNPFVSAWNNATPGYFQPNGGCSASKSYRTHRVLSQVVAQFQLRIFQEATEPTPKRQLNADAHVPTNGVGHRQKFSFQRLRAKS